jgi:hypothetical protein
VRIDSLGMVLTAKFEKKNILVVKNEEWPSTGSGTAENLMKNEE